MLETKGKLLVDFVKSIAGTRATAVNGGRLAQGAGNAGCFEWHPKPKV